MRRLFWVTLFLSCGGLLGYSVYRAVHLSLVHDESLSYAIVAQDAAWRYTANNHRLNTAAMDWAYHHMGGSEWSLRLANVLAHLIYLAAGLLILRKLNAWAAILLGFGLLNLNPFLLDFFGLARGYGIAGGFSLLSLLLLQQAWDDFGTTKGRAFLFLSSVAMALAVLGNFSWLNLQLAFLAVALILILADFRTSKARSWRYLAFVVSFLALNIGSVYYVSGILLELHSFGGLDAGSDRGFIQGTFGSLAQYYLYDANHEGTARDVLLYSVLMAVGIAGLWLIRCIIRERRVDFSGVLFSILVLACLAPVSEHIFFGTMFPADRSALYYVPLIAVFMASVVNGLETRASGVRFAVSAACAILTAAMLLNFAQTANLKRTLIWEYDANTKDVMTEIEMLVRESGVQGPVTIGNHWAFEPSINYYRLMRKYTWLEPADRKPPEAAPHDFLYCFLGTDLGEARKSYVVVKEYPDTRTELLAGPRIRK